MGVIGILSFRGSKMLFFVNTRRCDPDLSAGNERKEMQNGAHFERNVIERYKVRAVKNIQYDRFCANVFTVNAKDE